MRKLISPVQQLLNSYWQANGLELSNDLLDHQEFLLTFEPTGDIDLDLAAFFVGVGQTEMLDRYRKLKLPIRGLAAQILDNHRRN